MAKLHFSVSSDYKEVIRLRQECEKLEEQLKKMDVNKSPDVAKALEAQLGSATSQYKKLVEKIGEAEAKITKSADNIIKATDRIVQAQEKISKTNSTGSGSASSVSSTETANIQAQAKAYDDLKQQIDVFIGSRDANIKRMINEQEAIRLINIEIKKITKLQGESSSLSSGQQKRLEQLNRSLLTHKTALSEIRQTLNNNIKLDIAATTSMNGLSQSLSRMRITYRGLTEEERQSPFGKELLASIQQADVKLKELDATIGNHQRNIGNYASGWNGLSMSIQQLGRELPSLAYGPQVFFSAISNNLPILADEIKRAKDEYKSLVAQGQKATPVWKQIVSSLFSWQTALTVGITLLTVYGKDIVEWMGNIFKGRDALKSVAEMQDDVNEKLKSSQIGNQIAELKKLQAEWKSLGKNIEQQNKFIKERKNDFDKLGISINNTREAENLFVNNTDKFLESLKLRAQATAAQELASEKYKEALIKQQEAENEAQKGVSFWDRSKSSLVQSIMGAGGQLNNSTNGPSAEDFKKERIKNLKEEANSVKNAADAYFKLGQEMEQAADAALKDAGIKKTTTNYAEQEAKRLAQIQKKIADELIKLQETNQQREIDLMKEGTEKKIAQINFDYKKQIEAIKKQSEKWAKEQGGTLTAEQTIQISTAFANARKLREKDTTSIYKEEFEAAGKAMNDYLSKYGTFMQKKLAITQEYEEKIKNSQNQGEAKLFAAERDTKLAEIETKAIKANIDWTTIFGEFGGMFKDVIKPVLEDAKKYTKTSEFKNANQSSQKELVDAINQMEKSIGGAGKLNFKKLGEDVQKYQISINRLNQVKEEEIEAIEELKKAQDDYEKVIKNGTKEEKNAAKEALDKAQKNADAASEIVQAQTNIVTQNQQTVSNTATSLRANMDNVTEGLSKLASSGLKSAYDGLLQLGKGAGGVAGKLADKLGNIPIIGWILSIIDILKDGLSDLISGLLDAIFNAVSGIVDDVLSGDLLMNIGKSIGNGLMNIGKALGENLSLGFWDLGGADYSSYNKMVDRYKILLDVWDELIDKKEEYIDISYGDEIIKVGKEAEELAQKSIEAYKNLGKERLNAGASAGSHSIGVRQRKNMSKEGWEEAKKALGQDFYNFKIGEGRMSGLFDLSIDQLEKLKEDAPTFWAKLDDDVRDYLNNIIEGQAKIEEIQKQVKEQLTQVSFDSMYDSFIDTLMDMDSSSKDFADDISTYFMRAMLANTIGEKYRDKLEEWYNKFAESMEKGTLDKDMASLRSEYNQYIEDAIKERDNLAKITGYDSLSSYTQEASKKGFAQASQDSVDELNGRFTAGQVAWEETKNQSVLQNEKLSILDIKADSLINLASDQKNIADETRTILVNSYMELQQISENTGAIIKPITEMRDKMNSWDSKIKNM